MIWSSNLEEVRNCRSNASSHLRIRPREEHGLLSASFGKLSDNAKGNNWQARFTSLLLIPAVIRRRKTVYSYDYRATNVQRIRPQFQFIFHLIACVIRSVQRKLSRNRPENICARYLCTSTHHHSVEIRRAWRRRHDYRGFPPANTTETQPTDRLVWFAISRMTSRKIIFLVAFRQTKTSART